MSKIEHVKNCLPFWEHLSTEEISRIETSLAGRAFSKGGKIVIKNIAALENYKN